MQAALVVILLLAILARAVFVGHYGWVSAGDVVMPAWGWMMLGLASSLRFWSVASMHLMPLLWKVPQSGARSTGSMDRGRCTVLIT